MQGHFPDISWVWAYKWYWPTGTSHIAAADRGIRFLRGSRHRGSIQGRAQGGGRIHNPLRFPGKFCLVYKISILTGNRAVQTTTKQQPYRSPFSIHTAVLSAAIQQSFQQPYSSPFSIHTAVLSAAIQQSFQQPYSSPFSIHTAVLSASIQQSFQHPYSSPFKITFNCG